MTKRACGDPVFDGLACIGHELFGAAGHLLEVLDADRVVAERLGLSLRSR
jgi:hypothetical protein